jgi:type I restriction enzyme M protein
VVMANGSMSSNSGGEGAIRAQLVEADLVSCMVVLPAQLFRSTGIPVCVWFFAKDKSAGKQGSVDRTGRVLFIDARKLGYMVDRAERAFSDDDIAQIANTYHAWRGTRSAAEAGLTYDDVAGFCRSATLPEIKAADYALTPGRYVGAAKATDDGEPIEDKIERLAKELFEQFDESVRLEKVVREQLGRVK